MKKEDEERLICESAQRSAEHYNVMIWTVFLVGIGLSLWILYTIWPLKNNLGFMHLFMLFIGFLVLVYCSLTIESFGRKKDFMYKILDKEIKNIDFNKSITYLKSPKIRWSAEIILSTIFLFYILIFFWVSLNKFSTSFNQNFILFYFSFIFFVVTIIFFIHVLRNWIQRPKYENIKIFKKK